MGTICFFNVFQAKQVFQMFQLIDGSELSEGISSLASHFSGFFVVLLGVAVVVVVLLLLLLYFVLFKVSWRRG